MAKDLLDGLVPDNRKEDSYKSFNRTDDINFKESFGGIPKSIMKFGKDKFLMDLIGNDDSEIGKIEGDAKPRGGGYAKNLRYSIYNPSQAKFILEYFTEPGYLVLDPFMGRGTRPMITTYLGRDYYGFDTSKKTVEWNESLLNEKFPDSERFTKLVHGDGTNLSHLQHNFFDAVFSCPPYYGIERYSGEDGDISIVSMQEFDDRISKMFADLYLLIKTSDYQKKKFHPVIFTVGSIRNGNKGLLDMSFNFQKAAQEAGFVLHDKLFTENLTPGAGFTFRRNYRCGFLTKNFETTLIFMKF